MKPDIPRTRPPRRKDIRKGTSYSNRKRCHMTGKIRHATEEAAMHWRQSLIAREACENVSDPRPVRAYACRFCAGFHVGHSSREVA